MKYTYIIYKDRKGEIRWSMKSRNGNTLAHGEGYQRKRPIKKLLSNFPDGKVLDFTSGKEVTFPNVSAWVNDGKIF